MATYSAKSQIPKHQFAVQPVRGNYYVHSTGLVFYILEGGAQVARVERKSGTFELSFRWYSDYAKARFMDYCDSISMEEACEAMLGHSHKRKAR